MMSKKIRVKIRTLHKWVAVIVGIQLTLWIVSGAYFAWISIENVRGDTNRVEVLSQDIPVSDLFPPAHLNFPTGYRLKFLKLDLTPKGFIYRLESKEGEISTFEAKSGRKMDFLSIDEAKTIAMSQVKNQSSGINIALIHAKNSEYKGPVPVYRVELDDRLSTRLYTDPWNGKLILQRNSLWRIYDFLWMLHIMDYSTREDFNNPWLRVAATAALGIIVSGYLLFAFQRPARKKKHS